MNILRFDSTGGASGDMILAALIDLGADPDALREQLAALDVGPFTLQTERITRHGMAGTQVQVSVPDAVHQPHRHLADIVAIIDGSALPPRARELAKLVFTKLAEAEAAVHGTTPDRIHFHEVGAVDSIVDVVGACTALVALDIDAVEVSPLPLGSGATTCAHGVLPLPVPATAALLKGHRTLATEEPFELVTPTGAALLTGWLEALPSPAGEPERRIERIGYGLGHRTLKTRPNILRASRMSTEPAAADTAPLSCRVLECNLDDTVPELIGALTEQLLAAGALDVFTSPVYMKKQRPATLLTVLCTDAVRDKLADLIFAESTTFGIREYRVDRTVLDRRTETVATPYGPVAIKIGSRNGHDITRSPEHADCRRLAKQHGVSIRCVYEAALRAG